VTTAAVDCRQHQRRYAASCKKAQGLIWPAAVSLQAKCTLHRTTRV
jgi:hypothetical protein